MLLSSVPCMIIVQGTPNAPHGRLRYALQASNNLAVCVDLNLVTMLVNAHVLSHAQAHNVFQRRPQAPTLNPKPSTFKFPATKSPLHSMSVSPLGLRLLQCYVTFRNSNSSNFPDPPKDPKDGSPNNRLVSPM